MTGAALALALILMPAAAFADTGSKGDKRGAFSWFGAASAKAQETSNRAPSISGIIAPTVLEVGAEGTWTVNASDPENGSLTYSVDWGEGGMLSFLRASEEAFVQTSTFTHAYDKAGTYKARFTVKDEDGRSSSSSVTVRVVKGEAPELAISGVAATPMKGNRAAITWKTNVKSDTTVFYGTSSPIDAATAASATGQASARMHRVVLRDLAPDTTYYFLVRSTAGADSEISEEGSFTTPASGDGMPVVKSFTGPAELDVDEEGTWTVEASDPENEALSYAITWGDEGMMSRMLSSVFAPKFVQTSTFTHAYAEEGTYDVKIVVKDADGNETKSTAQVVVGSDDDGDGTAPELTGLSALVNGTSIVFDWDTDIAASSKVHYSASSPVVAGAEGTMSVSDDSLATDHSVRVEGLSAGTLYHFIVESEDEDGDAEATSEFSLMTLFK